MSWSTGNTWNRVSPIASVQWALELLFPKPITSQNPHPLPAASILIYILCSPTKGVRFSRPPLPCSSRTNVSINIKSQSRITILPTRQIHQLIGQMLQREGTRVPLSRATNAESLCPQLCFSILTLDVIPSAHNLRVSLHPISPLQKPASASIVFTKDGP